MGEENLKQEEPLIPEEEVRQPSLTYNLGENVIRGMIDGRDAMEQAIKKVLQTERYDYSIYSDDYGFSVKDIIGKPLNLAAAMAQRRITQALMEDDRIVGLSNFKIKRSPDSKNALHISFVAKTLFGDIPAEKRVNY